MLPFHLGDTDRHMNFGEEMVVAAGEFGPLARWHATRDWAVVVGPSVGLRSLVDAPTGIRVIRRPTGGGAVLVGPGLLGLDVALPVDHGLLNGDIVGDYRWIAEVWKAALIGIGVDARVMSLIEAREAASALAGYDDARLACFARPSPFEVFVSGRKVVGLSQLRRRQGVLFSSAVHIDMSPASLAAALPLSRQRRNRLATHLARHAASLADVAAFPVEERHVMDSFRVALWQLRRVRLRLGALPPPHGSP